MIEADPMKQNVFLARENPPRFAPEGSSSSSRGRSQDAPRDFRPPRAVPRRPPARPSPPGQTRGRRSHMKAPQTAVQRQQAICAAGTAWVAVLPRDAPGLVCTPKHDDVRPARLQEPNCCAEPGEPCSNNRDKHPAASANGTRRGGACSHESAPRAFAGLRSLPFHDHADEPPSSHSIAGVLRPGNYGVAPRSRWAHLRDGRRGRTGHSVRLAQRFDSASRRRCFSSAATTRFPSRSGSSGGTQSAI